MAHISSLKELAAQAVRRKRSVDYNKKRSLADRAQEELDVKTMTDAMRRERVERIATDVKRWKPTQADEERFEKFLQGEADRWKGRRKLLYVAGSKAAIHKAGKSFAKYRQKQFLAGTEIGRIKQENKANRTKKEPKRKKAQGEPRVLSRSRMMSISVEYSSIDEIGTLWVRKYTFAAPRICISSCPEMRRISRYFATRFRFISILLERSRNGDSSWMPL